MGKLIHFDPNGTKAWRFRHLPNSLHLRARSLAATLTASTQISHTVEETMTRAVRIGLEILEQRAIDETPADLSAFPAGFTPGAPPRLTPRFPDPDDEENVDWRDA